MQKITVTSKGGKKIDLIYERDNRITANADGISFGVTQTATGFESTLRVSKVGNKYISVTLTGADLENSNNLFAVRDATVAQAAKAWAEYDRRYYQIINTD
jgi:hypothetical protein